MAENDWLIGLVAGLDENKSKEQIKADIAKIKKSLDSVELSVKFTANQKKEINSQLDKLEIELGNVHFSESALKNLVAQVNNALKRIEIAGLNTNNDVLRQANQFGQRIGDSVSQGIGQNEAILENFKKSLSNDGMDISLITNVSDEINKLNVQISNLKQNVNENEILTVGISGIDEFGQAVTLTRQFDTATGELKKSLDEISTATQKAGSNVNKFAEKQKDAVASARNSLATIESKLNDKGANKTLANTDFNSNGLNTQIGKVNQAITALEQASRNTFAQAKRDVDKEINSLNNLITTLKNAEYAATSLRTKDIATVKVDEGNKLEAFVQKMEQSGHYTDDLKLKVAQLKDSVSKVFDVDSLTKYLNRFSNLQSEFQKIDTTAKTLEKSTKIQANVEAEKKILQIYKNELKEAGVLTGEVKDKIQEMFYSLSKVDSQTGLTTWRAELRGVKAETDAVLKSVTQLSQKELDQINSEEYDKQFSNLIKSYERLGLTSEEIKIKTNEVSAALDKLKEKNLDTLESDAKKFTNELKKSQNEATILKNDLSQIYNQKKQTKLSTDIQNWLSKNTRASKEAKESLNAYYRELNNGRVSVDRLNYVESELKKLDAEQRTLKRLGKNLKDQFKQAGESFTQWLSISSAVMFVVSKTKEAVSELKEVDTLLTEISKANDKLTSSQLKVIGSDSFGIASKYGKTATDYLSGVQEASRAGYENAEAMAELSVAAQGAGDMTAELANKYIIATDKAYKLGGSVEKLTEILDGSNYITNHNAVQMTELAEGMTIVGSQAASLGVEVNETTAAVGTMIAVTQQSGSEMARAFRAILLNIRQISDSDEGIDTESLTKYEKACNALNVSLKETKNGITSLRDPMEVIKELSIEYSKLEENDIRRTNLLNSVGGKLRANALDALLMHYDMYSTMLEQYAQGSGSMAAEAEKTANSLEGSLNRLSNTWTDTVDNVVNSDGLKFIVNTLNVILSGLNGITDLLGSWGSIGAGIGILTSIKNVGRPKMFGLFEYADSDKCSYGYISFLNAEYGTYIFVNEA